ncbi:hypothetical protein [Magnetospirillum molischianum]|uniref:Pyrimidine deaminase n=1 Tax=Magnetospirillum molischianum DSM 120 TaxID=1150626 RepID=H8FXP7_MAGML|nr:hypothetical protein [Magnetospirillum molischianum]CCG43135.1 Pyrimidine deaminase [Magnetospirillum molischianum DSM 120]
MFRCLLVSCLSICAVAPALADPSAGAPTRLMPDTPLVITISKPDCSRLIRHIPDADVAYRPGVDARGRRVVSADLDPVAADFARRVVPDVLEIPITINPLTYNKERQGNTTPQGIAKGLGLTQSKIGTVKYDFARDSFTFNDQPMMLDDQRALAAACARRGVR